jgi:hypothetical protein
MLVVLLVAMLSTVIPTVQGATPVNESLEFVDPYSTNYALAEKKAYTFQANVSDADGGTDIEYVEFWLEAGGGTANFKYRWTEATDVFSEQYDYDGSISISSDASDSTLNGNTWTLDFELTFHWNYSTTGLQNCLLFTQGDHGGGDSDMDFYANFYQVETDLTIYNLDESDNRINPSDTIYLSGSLKYEGTSEYPPNGDYNVNASIGATVKGTDNTLINGEFNITVTAESTVNSYQYVCEADYDSTPNNFAIVIVDQIKMNVTANDYYADVDQTVTFTVTGKYKYDGLPCSGLAFDVARNGTYNTSSTPFYDVRSTGGIWNYTVTNANETQYDLTSFTTDLIWVEWGFHYNFYGVYDEDTGLLMDPSERAVNITVHWTNNITETFELNGTASKTYDVRPLLFEFDLNKTREYWLSPGDASFDFYVFEEDTEYYTIEFLDLAGILDTYQYISARRLVNGTYMTVEKRKVDTEDKVIMALGYMERYNIVLGDTVEYTYGDVEFGLSATVTLTIRGIDFPRAVTMIYRYVRIYGERGFGSSGTGNITITYEDTLSETNSITLYFKYVNGTIAHTYATVTNSLVYTWSNALNNTAYYVDAIYYHDTFGTQTWKQYFPRGYTSNTLSLNWLGSLGFDTSIIIPALIIIFVAVCFSVLNAYLGAFLTVIVAIILTWMGMIPISPSALVTAFALAIMMGIIYMKRKVQVG